MIREATLDDLDAIMALSRRAHGESPYRNMVSDQDYVRRMALIAIRMPNFCVFVSDEEGEITGMMVGCVKPNAFGILTASDVILYAAKAGPGVKLFSNFRHWARNMPAQLTTVTSSFGNEKFERFLGNTGMERIGALFISEQNT